MPDWEDEDKRRQPEGAEVGAYDEEGSEEGGGTGEEGGDDDE